MKLATTKQGDAAEIPGQAYKNRMDNVLTLPETEAVGWQT